MRLKITAAMLTFTSVLALSVVVRSQGPGNGQGNGAEDASKIQIGFAIAPVPLNMNGRNPSLVGLGSYIVNAQADCAFTI